MTKGEVVQNGLNAGTLIDEHVYVPAKMLWAVITIAAVCLLRSLEASFGSPLSIMTSTTSKSQISKERRLF